MVCQDPKDPRELKEDKDLLAQLESLVKKEKLEFQDFLVLLEGMDYLELEVYQGFLAPREILERMV